MGLMQIMPATAREYRVRNPYDPRSEYRGRIKRLKALIDQWGVELALAAYNAGEGAVEKFNGVPPYRETRTYVSRSSAWPASDNPNPDPNPEPRPEPAKPPNPTPNPEPPNPEPAGGQITRSNADSCVELGEAVSDGIPLQARHRRPGKSSRASTSPTTKPVCATSSRRRASTSSRSVRPAARARRPVAAAAPERLQPRVPRLQPGTGHAAQGRHAARAVARPPAPARVHNRRSSRRCSTTCTSGCGRAARCRTPSRRTATLFPGVYTASLLAGERSGNLDAVLRRYVELREDHRDA